MRQYLFPMVLGVLGVGVLTGLGIWQLQRLDWKEALLTEIEGRIADAPVNLPATVSPEADAFLAVRLEGTIDGDAVPIFGTWRGAGAGYRTLVPFQTDTRRVLADLGVSASANPALPAAPLTLVGNLSWPDEVEPNPDAEIWTNLDVTALAARFDAEPVLVIARDIEGAPVPTTRVPVGTDGIPNNHFGYAVQWFGLALVWAGMTAFLLRRMHSQTGKHET